MAETGGCHKEIFCQVTFMVEFCDASHFILFIKTFISFGFSSVSSDVYESEKKRLILGFITTSFL